MYVPNGFIPSNASRRREYDEEGRLREVSISSPSQDGGIAESNSAYATEAEQFGTIAPFLARNKAKDARRRNYVIQPGGACLYFETPPEYPDYWQNGRVMFDAPTQKESFGHNSQPGGPTQGPSGRSFSLGREGGR